MDLIQTLSSKLGIDNKAAQALAGQAMSAIQGAVKNEAGDDAAEQLQAAVPEMKDWKDTTQQVAQQESGGGGLLGGLMGGGGGGGDLLSSVAGALGGQQAQDTAGLIAIMGKLGLEPGKATMVAPVVMGFLKERLNPGLLSTVLKAAPGFLGEAATEEAAPARKEEGGIGGLIGGLFG